MAFPIAWILNELGQKMYAWSSTKAIMDFDRGGEKGQLLQETLKNLENSSISTYICKTDGNIHNLIGSGSNIKFIADAPFNDGDVITINGVPVTAKTQNGKEISEGAWALGAVVVCYFDGFTLNFKGGDGLSAIDKANLIPENIRNGVTIAEVTGNLFPSNEDNSLSCMWLRVYDNANAPIMANNVTDDSPISVNNSSITIKRNFSAFVSKWPVKFNNGYNGSSNIPTGQVDFLEGQSFNVSVSVPHGNNNTSGIMIQFIING